MSKEKKLSYIITTLLVLALFIILEVLMNSGLISRYWESILILICINIIMATSLNLTVGVLGQVNLGHAGFMAIGAYTAGIFLKTGLASGPLGFVISLVLAALVSGFFGILIGLPILRLRGDYLAIVTLSLIHI